MCDYVVLPLLNSSFEPGRAREVVEGFVDVDLRNIARAELFYFTGQAEECCEITRGYLSSRVIELKLSACILYGYSNLTLGNVAAAKRGMEGIQSCVKIAMKKKVPKDVYASCLLAGYVGAVLLHLPTDGMPAFGEYSRMLPEGLIEACIRNRDPEAYQRITEGVISFSRGWMALHNPENRRKVTGELSTMEFSIAMLASGGWTNKEIGEHLGISINTVKHYLTDIFCKLNVKKRDELKKFMLK